MITTPKLNDFTKKRDIAQLKLTHQTITTHAQTFHLERVKEPNAVPTG